MLAMATSILHIANILGTLLDNPCSKDCVLALVQFEKLDISVRAKHA
jgi:hypothetical protein